MQNNILVLGAVDKVVDELQSVGPIDTSFMWSPNNEQLAFVAGNNLQIYNFFGTATQSSAAIATSSNSATNLTGKKNLSIFKQFDFIK